MSSIRVSAVKFRQKSELRYCSSHSEHGTATRDWAEPEKSGRFETRTAARMLSWRVADEGSCFLTFVLPPSGQLPKGQSVRLHSAIRTACLAAAGNAGGLGMTSTLSEGEAARHGTSQQR